MNQPYHYTECGLDNVYLYNISLVKDSGGEEVIYIPRINQLHKTIAFAITNKKGLISSKEIRFLRTLMGLKQSEFSSLLGKEAQACGRWERQESNIDKTIDTLIRIITAKFLNTEIDVENIQHLNDSAVNDNIDIDGADNTYKLMAA